MKKLISKTQESQVWKVNNKDGLYIKKIIFTETKELKTYLFLSSDLFVPQLYDWKISDNITELVLEYCPEKIHVLVEDIIYACFEYHKKYLMAIISICLYTEFETDP